jgi:hypothetical protein
LVEGVVVASLCSLWYLRKKRRKILFYRNFLPQTFFSQPIQRYISMQELSWYFRHQSL